MTTEMLFDAIGAIDDADIRAAGEYSHPVHRKTGWGFIAACLAISIVFLGTAYAQGIISFHWIGTLFGINAQSVLLEGEVISVGQIAVSEGITLNVNSIVTDGTSVYVNFTIDKLSQEDVLNNLHCKIAVPTLYGYGGANSIIPVEGDGERTETTENEYVLRYTASGLRMNLLGKTITLTIQYCEERNDGNWVQQVECKNEWIFKIKLNNEIEKANYLMADNTRVTVSPISFALEQKSFFNHIADHYRVELSDGRMIALNGSSSYENGHIDENGNRVARYKISTIMFEEIIDPHGVAALWVDDMRYELIQN